MTISGASFLLVRLRRVVQNIFWCWNTKAPRDVCSERCGIVYLATQELFRVVHPRSYRSLGIVQLETSCNSCDPRSGTAANQAAYTVALSKAGSAAQSRKPPPFWVGPL